MKSSKLNIEQFIVDCIEIYCKNRNIDRTMFNTIFDDCLNKQGFKIEDHKLAKYESIDNS